MSLINRVLPFLWLTTMAYAGKNRGIELFINHDDIAATILKPLPNQEDTTYMVNACENCKVVIHCVFATTDCMTAAVLSFTGNDFYEICPDDTMGFVNISQKNSIFVTLSNPSKEEYVNCNARATKPFIGITQDPVDSSEFGLSQTARKKSSCRCGWANKNRKRIIGGKETGINEYPFVVHLKYKESPESFCGGSIITDRHVLTAAHCFEVASDAQLAVVVGDHDLMKSDESTATKEIDVQLITVNKYYNREWDTDDIAILFLAEKIVFSDRVGPVCLPNTANEYIGQYVKVMGWGYTKPGFDDDNELSPVLKEANLRILDPQICSLLYNFISTIQLCTYNDDQDSCAGDSGGPVVAVDPDTNMFYQIGLVSYGKECGSTNPSINTKVDYYLDWINQRIRESAPEALRCY